jgi:hypothetical protein
MKKVIISTIITAGILLAGNAQANYINPVTESKLVKICEAIKSDSLIKVNIVVRDSSIDIKKIANGLVSNGVDSASFPLAKGAKKTAKCMAKKSKVNQQAFLANL